MPFNVYFATRSLVNWADLNGGSRAASLVAAPNAYAGTDKAFTVTAPEADGSKGAAAGQPGSQADRAFSGNERALSSADPSADSGVGELVTWDWVRTTGSAFGVSTRSPLHRTGSRTAPAGKSVLRPLGRGVSGRRTRAGLRRSSIR
jgi:hypothetical protein